MTGVTPPASARQVFAIALDGRYDVRQINLQGASERQPVAREDLRDLSLGNRDLRLGLGLAFRL